MTASQHLPTASWWIGVSREDWPAVVAKETERMTLSPFGQSVMLMTAPTVDSDEARRSAKRRAEGTLL